MSEHTIKIKTNFIQLAALLKFSALCESGGEAKIAVQSGLVRLNSEICKERGKKIYPGDVISLGENFIKVEHE